MKKRRTVTGFIAESLDTFSFGRTLNIWKTEDKIERDGEIRDTMLRPIRVTVQSRHPRISLLEDV